MENGKNHGFAGFLLGKMVDLLFSWGKIMEFGKNGGHWGLEPMLGISRAKLRQHWSCEIMGDFMGDLPFMIAASGTRDPALMEINHQLDPV